MTEFAAESNINPAATEENSSAIPQQSKDKAHCFNLELAKKQGEEAAVILQGLGYKVATSTKIRDGKKWHYDPLRVLETRWPYLTDSGIHGIIERQIKAGNIFTERYNKQWWRDKTTWYSVPEDLQKLALNDDGKIWFDVPSAVKCHSIVSGTLYQNLRFQLLLFLAENPEFQGVPYHRVNKTALARVLPWSLSTIQRAFLRLEEHGFVVENPLKTGEYTILMAADLVVPDAMKEYAVKNRSTTEMGTKSSTEMTKSNTEMTRSSTEMTKSSTDNITHYKPIGEAIHKHHSLPAPPVVVGECADAADAAKDVIHHDIIAVTVPVSATMLTSGVLSLAQLRQQIHSLKDQVSEAEIIILSQQVPGLTAALLMDCFPIEALRAGWMGKSADEIIRGVLPTLRTDFAQQGAHEKWSPAAAELAGLMGTEIAAGTFLLATQGEDAIGTEFKHCLKAIWDAHEHLQVFGNRPDATAEDKADSLIHEIRQSNRAGWPTYRKDTITFKVSASTKVRDAALEFFQDNPDLTTHDVWVALSDCVEVHERNTAPAEGYDPFWKSRRGINPTFLFKFWDDIKGELDRAEILSH